MFVGGSHHPYLPEKYEEARRMRRRGVAIKRIAVELGVSPGTVHRWTTDIELTHEQRERNMARSRAAIKTGSEARRRSSRQQRLAHQREGRTRAREGDSLHQAGCMLYWAEGAKDRNRVGIANSDRRLLAYFKRFLDSEFALAPDRYVFSINVYLGNGLSLGDIETTWRETLGLPAACARKHITNHTPTSSSGRRKNKLPQGVCTLKVLRSTPIVQHIYGAIQEYAGFDEPAWLD